MAAAAPPWQTSWNALGEPSGSAERAPRGSPGWKHVGASRSVTGHAEYTASAGRGLSIGQD
eukprot:1002230-Pyramimonas_sp.AAC.1